jgi:acetyl esterase
MELWPAEFEGLRAEARRLFDAGAGAGAWPGEPPEPGYSLDETIRAHRAAVARSYDPRPEADERLLGGVWCRVFVPAGPATAVYLHFHGGGLTVGAPEMDDAANHAMVGRFGVAVVSIDYRLAPEHHHSDAVDDGVAVARWLIDAAGSTFGSPRILLGGEDAGAGLAVSVLLRLRDEGAPIERFIGANLVAGLYDWSGTPSQRGRRPTGGPDALSPELLRLWADACLPDVADADRRDPAVSPAHADLRALCPALVSVGTSDHLLDDSLLLAARWAAAGGAVELLVLPELPHGFARVPCGLTAVWAARTAAWFASRLTG